MVLLEAMRAAIPVVASAVGGIRETLGNAPWVVPGRSEEGLARAVLELLRDPFAGRSGPRSCAAGFSSGTPSRRLPTGSSRSTRDSARARHERSCVRGKTPLLSIVVPVHDEEANVEPLFEELVTSLDPLHAAWEVLFVDDGSRDATFPRLRALHGRDPRVRVLRLRRNFGQTRRCRPASITLAAGSS